MWEVERERMLHSGQGAKGSLQERRQLTQEKQMAGHALKWERSAEQ